jgi:Fe-S cluster assembly protein SufD
MSFLTIPSVTQDFLKALSAVAPKAVFTPFDKLGNALKFLEAHGIPDAKNEEYKYANIDSLIRRNFKELNGRFLSSRSIDLSELTSISNEIRLVIVNGKFESSLSSPELPEGLLVTSLTDAATTYSEVVENYFGRNADENSDALIAMNTAFAGDGFFIHVKKNKAILPLIHVVHMCSSEGTVASHTRNLIVLEENAQLLLRETFLSGSHSANYLHNNLTEIFLAKAAVLNGLIFQQGNTGYCGLNTISCRQHENSIFHLTTFSLDGNFLRNNVNVVVEGKNAETTLNGLSIADGNQLVDHHTKIDHAVPECTSHELYKGIANGKSTLVFNGKIFVRPDAQKINAYQSSKNILLSDEASVNTKPQLEIFANDVKCSHGTSTGKVDENALFYLKARGVGDTAAKKLLLQAFATELLTGITNEEMRDEILITLEKFIETKC